MRHTLNLLLFALVLTIAPGIQTSLAQEDPHAGHAAVGYVPREILERPLPLRKGVGMINDKVTTSSAEAQAFYNQGVAYLHSYVWIEAARSFNHALRLDPKLAMAYVGLSRAYSGLEDPKAAREALDKAEAMAGGASERERRRIAIRAKQLEAMADLANGAKHLAYKKAIDDALAADMNDSELWLIRGNAEETTAAGRGQRGTASSIAFYERVLKVSPDNFAAHHYLIHSYETINQIDDALRHGAVYARLSFSIPHAHHMYGHDLRRVGRIEEAIAAFRKADELEHAYYKSENILPDYDWHHPHNLDLLSTSYQYMGKVKEAERLMRETISLASVSDYREFNKKEWPAFLLARGRTNEALEAALALAKGKHAGARAVGHIYAGHALLVLGRIPEATEELAAAEKEGQELPRVSAFITKTTLEPYAEGLRAEIYLRSGKMKEGREILKEVMRRLRAVPGPDAWSQGLFRLEAIARAAREVGDWELAEYAARQMLDHDPAYAGTHYALALVAEHKRDKAAARKAYAAAEKYWRNADRDLPELSQVRANAQEQPPTR
ncbi:MAG TPA: tetratricopeptide repeat protein [Blastocatellia bacterium]|nr:tetratricopeptide repeat protein [Blastocatellia bacterium]